jgi:hypothetical protein
MSAVDTRRGLVDGLLHTRHRDPRAIDRPSEKPGMKVGPQGCWMQEK